eukprot:m.201962 g.201962  ORF g.201962 m.201962 type:complete len:503 (+) comp15354_c0_seq7:2635-4143(+)
MRLRRWFAPGKLCCRRNPWHLSRYAAYSPDAVRTLSTTLRSLASQAEVRADSELLRTAYKTAVTIMGREHAQIRLGCLHLYQYLFMRSALFRELAVLDFQTMVELCIGVDDVSKPLPPPKRFARDLRTEALKFVQGAHAKFGTDYKQISLAYNFLRRRHKVDFEATQEASRAEQEAADQRAAAITRQHTEACTRVRAELQRWRPELERALSELTAAFPLAVPDITAPAPVDPTAPGLGSDDPLNEDLDDGQVAIDALARLAPVAEVGGAGAGLDVALGGVGFDGELTLAVGEAPGVTVRVDDNEALLDVISEGEALLTTKFIPKASGWVTRIQGNTAQGAAELLPELLSLRTRLEAVRDKCRELKVVNAESDDESDDEEELVDVDKFDFPGEYQSTPSRASDAATAAAGPADAGPAASSATEEGSSSELQKLANLGLVPQATVDAALRAKGKRPQQKPPKQKQKQKKRKPETALVELNSSVAKSRKKLKRMLKRPPAKLKAA